MHQINFLQLEIIQFNNSSEGPTSFQSLLKKIHSASSLYIFIVA